VSIVMQAGDGAVDGFDYGTLDPEAAGIIRGAAERIRATMARTVPEIGRELLRAKGLLPHGRFTAWAEAEIGMNARTAENYMRAARFLDGKPESVSVLPQTMLYALSAPTAPAELVQEVVAAAEAGEPLPAPVVKQRLNAAKHSAEVARRQANELDRERQRRRNPDLTSEELDRVRRKQEARTRQRRKREKEERDAAERRRQQEEQDRIERLRPLADRILLALDPDDPAALRRVLDHWQDRQTLADLLVKRTAGGEA
jgi:hypothetical protein